MPGLTLVGGNRNYSSWSLRPWILLQHLGLEFTDVRLPLDTPQFHAEIERWSPARKVPVLVDGDLRVWESIAILEYLDEKSGGRAWPQDVAARAHARAIAAEMHAGFQALRSGYPMNVRARGRRVPLTPELSAAIARIDSIWTDCRRRYGALGPWLFGAYTAADAMYAPVAFRFRTYGTDGLGPESIAYVDTVVGDPLVQPWVAAAVAEHERIEHEEVGLT